MMSDQSSEISGILSTAALDFMVAQLLDPVAIYGDMGKPIYLSPKFLTRVPLSDHANFFDSFASKTTVNLDGLWQQAIAGNPASFRLREAGEGVLCSLHFSAELRQMFVVAKLLTSEDITQDKELYKAWARVEDKWTAFAVHSLNLFLEVDETGQINYSTPAIEQVLGYTVDQALRYNLLDWLHPQDLNDFDLTFRLWVNHVEPVKNGIECRWKNAANEWVYLYVQRLQVDAWQAADRRVTLTAYNITDRKLLEAELQASEQKFRSLVLNMPGAAFRCDGSYTMGYMSEGIQEVSGYPASDFINDRRRAFLSVVHPEDIELIEASIEASMQDNHACVLEYRIIHADGGTRWISEYRNGVFHKGNLLWFDGILLDISDRKRAESRLRRSASINRALVQAMPGLMMRVSRQGEILSLYPPADSKAIASLDPLLEAAFSKIVVGHALSQSLPLAIAQPLMACVDQAFETGEVQVYQFEALNENLIPQPEHLAEAQITVIGKDEVLVIVRDITEHQWTKYFY